MDWQASEWEFETERLRVVGWRRRGDEALAAFLTSALTEDVTRELPPSWQAGVTRANAREWIDDHDRQGATFLVESVERGDALGVFMFFPDGATLAEGQVRLGYVFAKAAWGRGYATELVKGFLRRWDDKGATAQLLAGVTAENLASQRVLSKAGFAKVGERDGILEYRREP